MSFSTKLTTTEMESIITDVLGSLERMDPELLGKVEIESFYNMAFFEHRLYLHVLVDGFKHKFYRSVGEDQVRHMPHRTASDLYYWVCGHLRELQEHHKAARAAG